MFEKVILVDIVVLMQEFFISFKFLKTLFLFVSAVVLIVLLIQIFVKFWSFFFVKKITTMDREYRQIYLLWLICSFG